MKSDRHGNWRPRKNFCWWVSTSCKTTPAFGKLCGRQHQSSDVCSQLFACMLASVGWQVSWSAVLSLSLQVSFISNCLIIRSRRENVGLLGWVHALECRSRRMFLTIEEMTNITLPPSTLFDLHKFRLYFFFQVFLKASIKLVQQNRCGP